jgi:hypothetical protein
VSLQQFLRHQGMSRMKSKAWFSPGNANAQTALEYVRSTDMAE